MDKNQEYAALKMEQLERVKQRDGFLNLTVVAVALVGAVAVQGPRQAAAWFVIPWVTFILGWAYLSNDDKVSGIAIHLRSHLDPVFLAESWEATNKGLLSKTSRRIGEASAYVVAYIIPTPVSLILFDLSGSTGTRWNHLTISLAVVEVILTGGLAAAFVRSLIRRRK
jgi:hypothetical protein